VYKALFKIENKMLSYKSQELTTLESIKLQGCEKIDLTDNLLKDVDGIEEAADTLTWCKLTQNRISNVKHLKKCKHLNVLNLGNNKVKNVKHLKTLKELKALILNKNDLTQLHGIEQLTQLNTLVISHNQLKEIDVSKLKNLQKLSCSNNLLEEMPDLKCNPSIQDLRLNNNQIKQIPSWFVRSCKKVKLLDLGNNAIDSFESLTSLKDLTFMESLNLKGNGVCNDSQYHIKMKAILPTLKILDFQNFAASYYKALDNQSKENIELKKKSKQSEIQKKEKKQVEDKDDNRGFKKTVIKTIETNSQKDIQNSDKKETKLKKKKKAKKDKKQTEKNEDISDSTSVAGGTTQLNKKPVDNGMENVETSMETKPSIINTMETESSVASTVKTKANKRKRDKLENADNEENKNIEKKKKKKSREEKKTKDGKKQRSGLVSKKVVKKTKSKVVLNELTSALTFGSGVGSNW